MFASLSKDGHKVVRILLDRHVTPLDFPRGCNAFKSTSVNMLFGHRSFSCRYVSVSLLECRDESCRPEST